MAHLFDYNNGWSGDAEKTLAEAERLAARAVETAPNDAFGHYVTAVARSFRRDNRRAAESIETALGLNPNFGLAHNLRGVLAIVTGDPAAGIPHLERAIRLDPVSSQQYLHFLGVAYLLLGKLETAVMLFRERVVLVPETDLSRAFLAAALGALGEVDEARTAWGELMRINPGYSLDEHLARLPFDNPADLDPVREGLRRAGLPPAAATPASA
jgi:adenylate cyclase